MGAGVKQNNHVERRLKLRDLRILLAVSNAGTMGRAAAGPGAGGAAVGGSQLSANLAAKLAHLYK